jgi:hypothetical protein
VRLGDPRQLLVQRERITRAIALGPGDVRRLRSTLGRADREPVDDVQLAGIAQTPDASLQLGLTVLGADRRRAGEHGAAVALHRIDAATVTGQHERGLHLLALDDHRAEVRADTAALEPRRAPSRNRERIDLAEVRRPFDRRPGEAERLRGGIVVHARMAVVLLLGQHLGRASPRSRQRDLGIEAHL